MEPARALGVSPSTTRHYPLGESVEAVPLASLAKPGRLIA